MTTHIQRALLPTHKLTAVLPHSFSFLMLAQKALAALTAAMSLVPLTNALPQAAPAAAPPYPDSVLYTWSATDAACKNTALKADCTAATNQICANQTLTTDYRVTVGECTAIYMYDRSNSKPSPQTCTAAYTQILTAGIGGALGYSETGNRTADPLYVVYPKTEGNNGNCFKKTGDTSPVLATNIMPNGQPIGTCPTTSKQKRALPILSSRQSPDTSNDSAGVGECFVEDALWGAVCTATCLAEVAATSWAGPFAVAGGLACFGGCEALGWKLFRNCMTKKGSNPDTDIFGKRATEEKPNLDFVRGRASRNICLNVKNQLSFDCPAMRLSLLDYQQCTTPAGASGASGINVG